MFYDADGTPFTPGNFSSTGGVGLAKPDFAAADGVSTTLPASGLNPFFGTSAATPHAAAIAALVWSYNPTLKADDVAGVLTNSCIGILTNIDNAQGTWNNTAGHGILMALEALRNTPLPDYSAPYFAPSFVPGSLNYASDGQFQMSLAGAPGFNYAISVSTNLNSWAPLATLPMTNTSSVFTDANPGAATRFYRAALVAP
jgi:subtilisin family serine protease